MLALLRDLGFRKISNFKFQISNSHGFTLIELLVAISIVAILSTVGIVVFSNATETARDTTRKNALKQIQTAIELSYEETGVYPVGSGIDANNKQFCVPVNEDFNKNLKSGSVPSDPKDQSVKYCYQATTDGKQYALFSILENCDEANVNEDECLNDPTTLSYQVVADDAFIAQAPPSVSPNPIHFQPAISLPSPSPSVFTRPTGIDLPPTCNGMSITPNSSLSWIGDGSTSEFKIKPFVSDWSKVSKVDVYTYQDPVYSMTMHPYENAKWQWVGSVTNSSGTVHGYVGGSFGGEEGAAVPYSGRYTARMDIYDKSTPAKKVAGWNTTLEGNCLQDFTVQDNPGAICENDIVVEPRDLRAYVIGNDVLLKWRIQNYNGSSGDQFYAYRSTEPGFTIDPSKRVISRFKPYDGQVTNNVNHPENSYFYRVSAFNEGGEVVSNQQVVANVPREKRWCSGTIFGPPSASAPPSSYQHKIGWKYTSLFANWWGWYIIGDNNYKFQVDQADLRNLNWCYVYGGPFCVSWEMPYYIAGNYKVQAFAECGRVAQDSGVVASYTETTPAGGMMPPSAPPANISAFITYDGNSENISWKSNSANTKGFNVYKDTAPFDMSRAVSTNESNSFLRQAYFRNVPSGKHYFAVQDQNQCGSGWSQNLEVNIP